MSNKLFRQNKVYISDIFLSISPWKQTMQVLNYSSKDIEGAMALTDFELAIQSRKMNGYTLFMCYYCRCNNEKKNNGVVEIINVESDDDMSSGDELPSKMYKK